MKHAYKSFLLENESPVKICGDESLYALQNTSNNTVTLQGSNTATEWVNVIDIPAGTTKHVQSAFTFLKANGELHVNRTQGSLPTPSLVDKVGNPISNNNPLPTSQLLGSTFLTSALLKQSCFVAHGISVPASAGNLSKFELFNPSNSNKLIVVYYVLSWQTSGTVTYKVSTSTSELSATESNVVKQNTVVGSTVSSIAKIYTKNDDATSANNVISQIPVASTTPNGTNISPLFNAVLLPNSGIRVESLTTNMAINGVLVWAEIDITDIPPL